MPGNPFTADVFPDGVPSTAGALAIHHEALDQVDALIAAAAARPVTADREAAGGTVALLRAPRAGFGKSHLLARAQHRAGEASFVIPLQLDPDRDLKWSVLFWQVIEHFHRTPSATGTPLTLLDVLARRLFALVNKELIREKRVPCAHPEEALEGLEHRYLELFDFQNPAQPVARWFAEHFERLLPVSARVLSRMAGLREEDAAAWLRLLCGYAQGLSDGDSIRMEGLRWGIQQPTGSAMPAAGGLSLLNAAPQSDAAYKDRLAVICRIAEIGRPLLLIFDHLDAFHGDRASAMRVAWLCTELSRQLPRSVLVVSVNDDLWSETFLRAVPSAIEDRLTGRTIALTGIGREDAEELLRSRLTQAGADSALAERFLLRFSTGEFFAHAGGRPVSPRTVLRAAAEAWEIFDREQRQPSVDVAFPQTALRVEDAALFGSPFALGLVPPGSPRSVAPAPAAPPAHSASNGEPSGSSAPVNGDNFRKLRHMLERMKAQRPEITGPVPEPEPPADAPLPRSVPSPMTSGVVLPEPSRPAPPTALVPPVALPAADRAALVRFHTLRAHFTAAPYLLIDQDRLYHLLKVTGQRLAVTRFTEIPLPSDPRQTIGVWQIPDGEILFGSEPYEDQHYWSELITFTAGRSGGPGPESAGPAVVAVGCRLVVFSSSQAPVNLSSWMRPDEIVHARAHFLDIHTVDQPTIAVMYAADEVLHEAESGRLGMTVTDAFQALAPQLEFLWKRLTRPLK